MLLQLPTPILPKVMIDEFSSYLSSAAQDWWITSALNAIFVMLIIGVARWIINKGLSIKRNLRLKAN